MFLVEDKPRGSLVFTWEDPRKVGFTGDVVEGVELDYDMDAVHSWPEGHARPEACVGRSPANPKSFKVFKYSSDREAAGYEPMEGTAVVGSWLDYLRSRRPDLLEDRQWYEYLEEVDEASRRRRDRERLPAAPLDKSRGQVAAWVAKRHLLADSGIREVWYLPRGSSPEEIRFVEVNDRLGDAGANAEAIDFGLDIEGMHFRLFVADVTGEQFERIKKDPSLLPPGWSLKDNTIWRRGA
jgi:hypothetical protein